MADTNNGVFGLFPQAPAQPRPLDPLQVLNLADQVNKLQLFQKDFQARQATGESYAAARRPDGSIDPAELTNQLSRRSAATNWNAPETAAHMVDLQRGQAELSAKRQGDFTAALGSLPSNATMEHVNQQAVLAAARGASAVEIMPQVHDLMRAWNLDQDAIRRKQPATNFADALARYRNMGIGPAGLASPVEGPPSPSTGRPTQQTTKQFLEATTPGTGVNPGGPQAKGLGPGEAESARAMTANNAREAGFSSEIFPWQQALAATNRLKSQYPEGGFSHQGQRGDRTSNPSSTASARP